MSTDNKTERTAEVQSNEHLDTPSPGRYDTDALLGMVEDVVEQDSGWVAQAVAKLKSQVPPEIQCRELRVGDTVDGRYQLVARLGSGGFGVVFRANDTVLDRDVALKLLHPTHSGFERYRKRFEQEARAAASIESDHVVRVYDVGTTANSLVYIAMELVEGETVSHWQAKDSGRSPSDIAQMVFQAAKGLAAAHQRGLIHRDIKCANLLIDRENRVKITDFGLATVTGPDAATISLSEQFAGTLPYMSPEQLNAPGDVDQRSDVYSLGVVLYELLGAARPFRGIPAAIVAQIAAIDPPPLRQLNPNCPRDLATIAEKCLRKEAGKRYQSAKELADDLQRWMNGEPIKARRAGKVEHLYRWCRRNPRTAALTMALCVSLLAGAAVSVYFAVQARREAATARREADIARAIDAFINNELLPTDTPNSNPQVPIKTVLLRAADNLEGRFQDQPEVKAGLHRTIGRSLASLGMYAEAEPHLLAAYKLRAETLGDAHPDTINSMQDAAWMYRQASDRRSAADWYTRALQAAQAALGADHPLTAQVEAGKASLEERPERPELQSRLAALADLCRQRLADDDAKLAATLEYLAPSVDDFPSEKQAVVEAFVEILDGELAERSPSRLQVAQSVGVLLVELEQFERGEELLRSVLAGRRELLSDSHPDVLAAIRNLAELYQRWRRFEEAASYWQPYIGTKAKLGDPNGLEYASSQLAYCHLMAEKYVEAETAARVLKALLGHGKFPAAQKDYAEVLLAISLLGQERVDEASVQLEAAVSRLQGSDGIRDHSQFGDLLSKVPALLERFGRHEEASRWQATIPDVLSKVGAVSEGTLLPAASHRE